MSEEPPTADPSAPSRREFIRKTGTVSLVGGIAVGLADRDLARPVSARPVDATDDHVPGEDGRGTRDGVFPHSVASGGPTETGVILWTRISPDEYAQGVALLVDVAADSAFRDVVFRGSVSSSAIRPAHDYTVKVDLDGELSPDTVYHYRFRYRGTTSCTGRCRTLPGPNADVGSLRLAVVTCQDYQNGYYGALHHVAEEDVDFLVHLGDFIYESANGQWKGEYSPDLPDRDITLPSGKGIAHSLADFRHLHRTYRSGQFLQEALESHTLLVGWDDHEVANNWYWDYEAGAPRAPHHPKGADPGFMADLTADGIQAWWEYLPARVDYDPDAAHLHDQFRLYRTLEFGDLATLTFTDERLFRNGPPCEEAVEPRRRPTCPEAENPDRTMLGAAQRDWFVDEITSSTATWTLWGNEVMFVPLKAGEGEATIPYRREAWGGFEHERNAIATRIRDAGVDNFVALTGDLHAYLAGYMQVSYENPSEDPSTNPLADPANRVGVELMTPAITSINLTDQFPGDPQPGQDEATETAVQSENRHLDLFDPYKWGYSVVEFTDDACTYRAYSVDRLDDSPDAEKEPVAIRRVPEGEVAIENPQFPV